MKQALTGAGFTAIIAIAVIILLLRKHGNEISQYQSLIEADRDSITYHKNKAGQAIAETAQAQISLTLLKQSHQATLDSISRTFGIREGQIKSYFKASFEAQNKGVTVIRTIYKPDSIKGDSIMEASFDISDGYIAMHGDSRIKKGYPWASVQWDYSYGDTLQVAGIIKKKNLFAKEHYFIDAVLNNPRARITSLKSMEIREFTDKRFGIGVQAGYDPFHNQPYIGIGVSYDFIKF